MLTEPVALTHDPADLDDGGVWAVVVTFEGELAAVRFARTDQPVPQPDPWTPVTSAWTSSMDEEEYRRGVATIREHIADGTVYQVNLCRMLTAPLPEHAHLPDLAHVLAAGNPAPFAGLVHVPSAGLDVVSASPEAYLIRDGDRLVSRPIKGTGTSAADLGAKDHAENVMITDLVRNDLSPVSEPGTVAVEELCTVEQHPGLVHLTSSVAGRLRPGVTWRDILAATFPPGSVSGAPKSSALRIIDELEPTRRGAYCGAVGWIDADAGRAELAVGIRTFVAETVGNETQGAEAQGDRRVLRFGTGAGITWGSDPAAEWRETELKAARLIGLASGKVGV